MLLWVVGFFFNDTATTEIYTLSLPDALPISGVGGSSPSLATTLKSTWLASRGMWRGSKPLCAPGLDKFSTLRQSMATGCATQKWRSRDAPSRAANVRERLPARAQGSRAVTQTHRSLTFAALPDILQ